MSNLFGSKLRVTIFGSSHGEGVGATVEGLPAGISLTADLFSDDIERRRPTKVGETRRVESDIISLSGIDADTHLTTGDRVTLHFQNSNIRSSDYSQFEEHPRPSHADLVQKRKYGESYNLAGGGIASGRMTLPLVAVGVIAKQLLPDTRFSTRVVSVGGESDPDRIASLIEEARLTGDSLGGIVECRATGVPALLGEPFFDSAESIISHLLFSIPAVKGVEFGDGFSGTLKRGSERNDAIIDAEGHTATNNEGGINGGITNGNDLVVRVAIKPTASISRPQNTYNFSHAAIEPLTITGRHDVCIARRAAVVIEAMVALALAELSMR